jgi:SAM-dependent methyltransferase
MHVIHASIYDYPKYYDLLFGSDWRAELGFLTACFRKHASRRVRRLFEPACGTGRLLVRFAAAGHEGNDINPRAVDYCNARLARHGFPRAAVVGNMADFRLRRNVDAAFNTLGSFQHLPTERAAESHLRCVADALATGGLYVLGFHLTPSRGRSSHQESWSARRGHLAVRSHLRSIRVDRRRRQETMTMTVDVQTPSRQMRLVEEMVFRTYTAGQFRRLLGRAGRLELVETYDFAYEIDRPIRVNAETTDVVYVLRKRR